MNKVLVLGIGNDILTDDGIGPKLVNDLKDSGFPGHVFFQTACVGGLEILELIQGFQKVIFIDAIITLEVPPGTVTHFNPGDFRETLHLSNLHDTNFLTAIEIGKKLKMNIPDEILIIAIEIVEDRTFSDRFTAEIGEKYPAIISVVKEMIFSSIDK